MCNASIVYGPDELRTQWRIIDLDFVDRACTPYRPESMTYFNRVRWAAVNDALLLALGPAQDDPHDAFPSIARFAKGLRRRDRPALSLMLSEPITAFPGQITNGIHRLTAMRGQGIRWTVGYYLVDDEGGTWMRSIDQEPF